MIKYISQNIVKTAGIVALTGLSFFTNAQTYTWGQAGPKYAAGRIRNMVVDKADPSGNTLYIGSTTSGVFKSTDAATTWTALPSSVANRVVSYMAQGADNTIYVATGEGFLRNTELAKAQAGSGLYKIVSGNLVQIAPASVTGSVITKVACSPTNPSLIAIAGSNGILYSSNGGSTFTTPAGLPTYTVGNAIGIDLKFNNSGILYITIGSPYADLPATNNSISTKISRSTDATLTSFTDITPTLAMLPGLTDINFGRIELAIAPSNNNIIYASCANKFTSSLKASATTKAFIVSYDAGTTWALIYVGSTQLDALGNGGTTSSGDRAHCIVVNPTNSDQVLIGSYQLYAWTRNNGSQVNPVGYWNKIGSNLIPNSQIYIRENIHDIKQTGSGSNIKYYFVTDAGIYKSSDNLLSFQPFYSGIVTGQFNTVSIERYPIGNIPTANGSSITPYSGFVGGTSNAGLNYFSGNYPSVTTEISYIGGEVTSTELSKILPNVAYASSSEKVYLNSDIKTGDFAPINVVKNSISSSSPGNGAVTGQATGLLSNAGYSTSGTPFKMWENYGQLSSTLSKTVTSKITPDSLVFYNDTLRFSASMVGVPTLISQTSFSWSAPRPNKFALIDSVVVRTGTVLIPSSPAQVGTAFTGNDLKQLQFNIIASYTVPPASPSQSVPIVLAHTLTAYQGAVITPSIATANNTISLNQATLSDEIKVNFAAPPFANKTGTSSTIDNASYYRVFCTVFYKYKANTDTVKVVDNTISTKTATYSIPVSKNITWRNLSNISSTVTAVKNDSIKKRNILKVASSISARFAFPGANNRIYVSTQPLSLNDPLSFICVSGDKALTCDATGAKTTSVINIPGKPTILEWSKNGLELYYATDDYKLYRVNYLHTLIDSTARNYNGKLHTGIFKVNAGANPPLGSQNPNSPYRTTLLGTFTTNITSISITPDDSLMLLTLNTSTGTSVMRSTADIRKANFTNPTLFTSATGTLNSGTGIKINTSLIEKTAPYKAAFVGTDIGLFYTSDYTAGASTVWDKSVNTNLPDAQIFDIKQQTMQNFECYNSGQIYVATNGRGVWATKEFAANIISVNENALNTKTENSLNLYPNPTNNELFVGFNGIDGETATINVVDVTGKVVLTQYLGKLYNTQIAASVDVTSLNAGIYIVNVTSTSGAKRVAKLIVTK